VCVCRFIAVTQPIKYAKHKNSSRVYAMLAMTWIISAAISSPIALGMNYTDRRAQTPTICTFYNSDFLIYSSMGSFYIPCVIMVCLYSRIFVAIRAHARKSTAAAAARHRAVSMTTAASRNVPDKSHAAAVTVQSQPVPGSYNKPETASRAEVGGGNTVVAVDMVGTVSGPSNDVKDATAAAPEVQDGARPDAEQSPTNVDVVEPAVWTRRDGLLLSPPGITVEPDPHTAAMTPAATVQGQRQRGSDASVVRPTASPARNLVSRFKLHGRRRCSNDKKSAEKSASRRERKATKTLAIVLGAFTSWRLRR